MAEYLYKGLIFAARCGHWTIIKLLMDDNDFKSGAKYTESAIEAAIRSGFDAEPIVCLMIASGRVGPTAKHIEVAVEMAIKSGFDAVPIVRLMLGAGGVDPNAERIGAAIKMAIKSEFDAGPILRVLLGYRGANPNRSITDKTADLNGGTTLHWAIMQGKEAVVNLLLENLGLDPNTRDYNGCTAMHWAVQMDRTEAIKWLLRSDRVDPNVKNEKDKMPFHFASDKGRRQAVDFVKLLIEFGRGNAHPASEDHQTALHLASLHGDMELVKLFVDSDDVDLNATTSAKYSGPRFVESEYGRTGQHCSTALQLAAEAGHAAIVKLLLDSAKVDPDAYSFAIYYTVTHHVTEYSIDRWQAREYKRALHDAVRGGHKDIVKLLLDTGKVKVYKPEDEKSVISMAEERGYDVILNLLLENADGYEIGGTLIEALHKRTRHGEPRKSHGMSSLQRLLDTEKIPRDGVFGLNALFKLATQGPTACVEPKLYAVLLATKNIDQGGLNEGLKQAVSCRYKEAIRAILATGEINQDGLNNAFKAVYSNCGNGQSYGDTVELLLKAGKVDQAILKEKLKVAVTKRDESFIMIFHAAAEVVDPDTLNEVFKAAAVLEGNGQIIKTILENRGSEINKWILTEVFKLAASSRGNHQAIKAMLDNRGSDIDKIDLNQAFRRAVFGGYGYSDKEVVQTIFNHASLDNVDEDVLNETLNTLVRCGHEEVVQAVFNHGNGGSDKIDEDVLNEAFKTAAQHGYVEIMKMMLDKRGSDIDKDDVLDEVLKKNTEYPGQYSKEVVELLQESRQMSSSSSSSSVGIATTTIRRRF
ncbi:ankyrin repeat-containing domain protein [Podospora fimiseda]|uniref:Ankyrin repeat-containing domain protein n=1 Tax=Podospora fimiseda TaxID=252190 RepID=A0AAN7GU10_9PEZI|nr:ankyrin repeat-containing domain protein [Podospora fimiseda]